MAGERDEFYVGYLDSAPPGIARTIRGVAIALALAVPLTVAAVALNQGEQPSGVFEFGTLRDFEGVLQERPLPSLRPAGAPDADLILVGLGKYGAGDLILGHHGERVRFRGTLTYQGDLTLVEITEPDSFEVLGPQLTPRSPASFGAMGRVELTGELVDTKCWAGVMRPATGKVHRACAVRCLAGGVPPGLLLRDEHGNETVLLLAGPSGGPAPVDPQLAARTVVVRGVLVFIDHRLMLRVDEIGLAGEMGDADWTSEQASLGEW